MTKMFPLLRFTRLETAFRRATRVELDRYGACDPRQAPARRRKGDLWSSIRRAARVGGCTAMVVL